MITGFSNQTAEPNIEHMDILFQQEEGVSPMIKVNIYREELTAEQQSVYDTAIGLVANNVENEILYTTSFMRILRMTSTPLTEGKDTKDFLTDYTEAERDDLRAFLALVVSLIE